VQAVAADAVKQMQNRRSDCLDHQLAYYLFQKALALEQWEAALTYRPDDEGGRAINLVSEKSTRIGILKETNRSRR